MVPWHLAPFSTIVFMVKLALSKSFKESYTLNILKIIKILLELYMHVYLKKNYIFYTPIVIILD